MDSGLEERILPLNPPNTNINDLPQGWSGEPGDLRSDRVLGEVIRRMETLWSGPLRGRETSQEQGMRCRRQDWAMLEPSPVRACN